MRRTLCASLGAALALFAWAGTAAADTGSPAAVPTAGQETSGDPAGDALAVVGQYLPDFGQPDGQADAVEPDTPVPAADPVPAETPTGPEGTSQANGSLAGSLAGNGNETGQTVTQDQGGEPSSWSEPVPAPPDSSSSSKAPTGGYTQVAGQSADSTQEAYADADSTQIAPSNDNVGIRVFSPGDNGPVTQSNDSVALAGALNGNKTTQDVSQSQTGTGTGYTQVAGQKADNDQTADAKADSKQVHPENTNISVRIFSPGDDGAVSQSNTSIAGAVAANDNETGQSIDQSQSGDQGESYTQVAGQKADNDQTADSKADSKQVHPNNTNISVRIFSPGDNGPVTQSNTSAAGALAANTNTTCQCITQSQTGGAGGGFQIAGQLAESDQSADADATSTQIHPSNENVSIRVGSPGADGPVSQSNASLALAGALNANGTHQSIDQQSGGPGVQAAGQKAANDQYADADADAGQYGPKNVNAPVRVLSPGGNGSVEQANAALAGALAANANETTQSIDQEQSGGPGGPYVQAAGQLAGSHQDADADADATQCCAENVNAPVEVLDKGKHHGDDDDGSAGSVEQSNLVAALAAGLNLNGTDQSIGQSQNGPGGTSVQAAGQKAWNDQAADADADAFQLGARNVNAPVQVLGKHGRCSERYPCDQPRPRKVHDPKPSPEETGSCSRHGDRWKQDERCGHPKPEPCRPRPCRVDDPCPKVDHGKQPEPCEWKDRCQKRDRCEPKDPCRHGSPQQAPVTQEVPMP
jgi:hypothetical protein